MKMPLLLMLMPLFALAAEFASHPPVRPLPTPMPGNAATSRVQAVTPADSLQEAINALQPGDTLYLHGGTYYQPVTVSVAGTPDQPVTIAGYPGELAIIDGGIRAFYETPATAWEPVPEGASHEYRSTTTYPDLMAQPEGLNLMGNFGDSMVPLHAYRFLADFRSDNPYWNLPLNSDPESGLYCGPGLWYNLETKRIHVRLAHTRLNILGDANYRGETDPRRLPLVIAGVIGQSPLEVLGSTGLLLQNLVVRGSPRAPISLNNCQSIILDHLTAYAGRTCIDIRQTHGLRVYNCAFRGLAAPWTSRAHLKYRSVEAQLFSAGSWQSAFNSDFELAWCEFTDSVDGVFVGNVHGLEMHHCLLNNVTDDGIFASALTTYWGTTPGGPLHIYQNVLARCLTTFAFGVGHGRQRRLAGGDQTGAGIWITRNFIDLREPVFKSPPKRAEDDQLPWPVGSRSVGDHGSPAWEPMYLYQNTIVARDPSFRNYYLNGWGGHVSNAGPRRVWNNIYVQLDGLPGRTLPPGWTDMEVDYNLHWSPGATAEQGAGFLEKLKAAVNRASNEPKPLPRVAVKSPKPPSAPGQNKPKKDELLGELEEEVPPTPITVKRDWGAHDRFADPQFAGTGLMLSPGSPAINAGRTIPEAWPDPLRNQDAGQPDLGMLPLGTKPWRVGVDGRLDAFGAPAGQGGQPLPHPTFPLLIELPPIPDKPAILVNGYPAFVAPILESLLEARRVPVTSIDRTWLPPKEYSKYGLVAITGNLERAGMEPRTYSDDDLPIVRDYVQNGGVLLLSTQSQSVFDPQLLDDLLGQTEPQDATIRFNLKIGKGRLICIDSKLANDLPIGREHTTLEEEEKWMVHANALVDLVNQLYPTP